jgi:hypothetical protein
MIPITLCESQQWFWDCDGLHNGHFEFVIKFEVVTSTQVQGSRMEITPLLLLYWIYIWIDGVYNNGASKLSARGGR